MTLDDLKKEFKNGNQFYLQTGMSHATWINWFERYQYIPIQSQMKLEKLTNGRLKASLNDIPIRGK